MCFFKDPWLRITASTGVLEPVDHDEARQWLHKYQVG